MMQVGASPDSKPALALRFFGPFAITVHGQERGRFGSNKNLALLAYLALNPDRAHSRTSLATLFWPDVGDQGARDNLRNTLHRLRKSLDDVLDGSGEILTPTRQAVQFHREGIAIDVLEFQDRLDAAAKHRHAALEECPECLERLDEAVSLYAGDLLAGFDLPDAEPFEEWLRLRRESFRHQVLLTLNELAHAYEARGQFAAAQRYVLRTLEMDPLREEAHRQAMRLFAWQQMPDQALNQFDLLRNLLDEEFGAEPDDLTRELALQISTGTLPGPIPAEPRPTPEPSRAATSEPAAVIDLGDIPHVAAVFGRDDEVMQLEAWLSDPENRITAILGLGGMGKTTLAAFTVARFADRFDAVIWRSLVNAPTLEELIRPILQHAQRDQAGDGLPKGLDEQLDRLFAYFQRRRLLLVLDNVESILDEQSAGRFQPAYEAYGQLFAQMVQRSHQSHLLLTSRERPNDFYRLERDSSAVRALRLAGLGNAAGHALLTQRGVRATEEQEAALVTRYSGNPLALKLVADTVQEIFDGDLSLFLTAEAVVFDDVRAILDQQFERLTPIEQDILFWLAVARRALTAADLRRLLLRQPSQRALLEALAALQRRSLIDRQAEGFTLQNVVTEYLTGRLIDDICDELEVGRPERLHAYALLHAHAEDHVRQSQTRLLLAPLTALFAARTRRSDGYRRTLTHLHAEKQDGGRGGPSYAGGNLLNLMLYDGLDVRGLNLSGLAVWQAYLRGANLAEMRFDGADLASSVFTDTFGAVYAVALSPDETLIAAGTADGEVRIWRTDDMQPIAVMTGHHDSVWSVAFSPDGQSLISVSADGTARVWNVADHTLRHALLGHAAALQALAVHPDGALVATGGGDQTIRLWDLASGAIRQTLTGHPSWIRDLAFSPDGETLISGGADGALCVWNTADGELRLRLEGHASGVDSIAFHPDGDLVASGGEDRTIRLWDIKGGELAGQIDGHSGPVRTLAFSPDGRRLASGSDDRAIRLWDLATGGSFFILHGHTNWVLTVAFSRDGTTLISGSEDRTVRTWNTDDGEPRKTLQGYSNWVYCVALRPDDGAILSGHGDNLARIWDMTKGTVSRSFSGHGNWVWAGQFSPDGSLAATASSDGSVLIWDVATGAIVRALEGHARWVRAVAFSPDGTLLATGSGDHTVGLWDLATGQRVLELAGHSGWVRDVAFSPDGAMLASAGEDHTVKLWNRTDGTLLATLTGHTSRVDAVVFTPAGDILASASEDKSIRIWEAKTGAPLNTLTGHEGWIRALAVSPDGRLLASGSHDQTIRLWDIASGAMLGLLGDQNGWVTSVAFDRRGATLVSGASDGAIRQWSVETGECLQILKIAGPYTGMRIGEAAGLSAAQRQALIALGARDE